MKNLISIFVIMGLATLVGCGAKSAAPSSSSSAVVVKMVPSFSLSASAVALGQTVSGGGTSAMSAGRFSVGAIVDPLTGMDMAPKLVSLTLAGDVAYFGMNDGFKQGVKVIETHKVPHGLLLKIPTQYANKEITTTEVSKTGVTTSTTTTVQEVEITGGFYLVMDDGTSKMVPLPRKINPLNPLLLLEGDESYANQADVYDQSGGYVHWIIFSTQLIYILEDTTQYVHTSLAGHLLEFSNFTGYKVGTQNQLGTVEAIAPGGETQLVHFLVGSEFRLSSLSGSNLIDSNIGTIVNIGSMAGIIDLPERGLHLHDNLNQYGWQEYSILNRDCAGAGGCTDNYIWMWNGAGGLAMSAPTFASSIGTKGFENQHQFSVKIGSVLRNGDDTIVISQYCPYGAADGADGGPGGGAGFYPTDVAAHPGFRMCRIEKIPYEAALGADGFEYDDVHGIATFAGRPAWGQPITGKCDVGGDYFPTRAGYKITPIITANLNLVAADFDQTRKSATTFEENVLFKTANANEVIVAEYSGNKISMVNLTSKAITAVLDSGSITGTLYSVSVAGTTLFYTVVNHAIKTTFSCDITTFPCVGSTTLQVGGINIEQVKPL